MTDDWYNCTRLYNLEIRQQVIVTLYTVPTSYSPEEAP